MISSFEDFPGDLKLKILSFVGETTLRQSVRLVSKEMSELSTDFTLYKFYKTSTDPKGRIKSKYELNHYLYHAHLKILITDIHTLREIQGLEFKSLEKVVVEIRIGFSYMTDYLNYFIRHQASTKPIDIIVQGEISEHRLNKEFIPCLKDVESVVISSKHGLENLFCVPARKYVISINTRKHDTLTIEEVYARFQRNDVCLEECSLGLELIVDEEAMEILDNLLHEQFSAFLAKRLVRFECTLELDKRTHQQLFQVICRDWIALEMLTIVLAGCISLPKIYKLTSNRLKNLILIRMGKRGVTSPFQHLLNSASIELNLHGWCLDDIDDVALQVKSLVLWYCDMKYSTLLYLLRRFESVELFDCKVNTLPYNSAEHVAKTPASVLLNEPRISPSNLKELILVRTEEEILLQIVAQLTTSLHKLHMDDLRHVDIDRVLAALLTSAPQLKVLTFVGESQITRETLKLLAHFFQLEYINIEEYQFGGEPPVSHDVIRQIFPTAIIVVGSHEHFIRIFI